MLARKGQSLLEYLLVLTAIIATIIYAVKTFVGPRVAVSVDHVTKEMKEEVQKIDY